MWPGKQKHRGTQREYGSKPAETEIVDGYHKLLNLIFNGFYFPIKGYKDKRGTVGQRKP